MMLFLHILRERSQWKAFQQHLATASSMTSPVRSGTNGVQRFRSPSLVVRQNWHESSRNLREGDVVMIVEPTSLKAKYKMGIIDDVKVSCDGRVRSAVVRYNNIQTTDNRQRVTPIRVTRSVQRLVLILPVEEQSTPLMINDDDRHLEVSTYIATN